MPSIISAVSFNVTFQINGTPQPTFLLTDTNSAAYSAASIPLTGIRGVFEIISPGGTTYYNNTNYSLPDITPNTSFNNKIPITLPVYPPSVCDPIQVVRGQYVITYKVQITDGVNPVYYVSQTTIINFDYQSPSVCIEQTVDCISPLFTSTDKTNYVVCSITPTITRTQTVSFPAPVSPVVSSAAVITLGASQFYLGEQYTVVSSILAYTFSNYFVTDTVTGQKSIGVNCEWACKISCCLKTFNIRLEKARINDTTLYQQLSVIAGNVAFKLADLMIAKSCGKQGNVNALIAQIQTLLNCNDDCGCNDGKPTLVVGLGGGSGNAIIIQSGNDGIVVTSTTVGSTTTWTITLSAELITAINNAYNTVVQTTDDSITWTASGIIDGVQTYTGSVNKKYILVHSDTVPSAGSPPANKTYTLLTALANTMAVGDRLVLEMVIEPNGANPVIGAGAGITINSQPTTTT